MGVEREVIFQYREGGVWGEVKRIFNYNKYLQNEIYAKSKKKQQEKIKKKKKGVEDIKNKQKKIVLPLPLTKSYPSKKSLSPA